MKKRDLIFVDPIGEQRLALSRSGDAFTLVELVGVLIILVILSAVVVPLVGGNGGGFSVRGVDGARQTPEEIATARSLETIRDATVGRPGRPGAWQDFTQTLDRLQWLLEPEPLLAVGDNPAGLDLTLTQKLALTAEQLIRFGRSVNAYDPVSQTGWRGPYLESGAEPLDGWGNSFVGQIDFDDDGLVSSEEAQFARIVSTGPNGVLDIPAGRFIPGDGIDDASLSFAQSGDDLVLFLRAADTRQ